MYHFTGEISLYKDITGIKIAFFNNLFPVTDCQNFFGWNQYLKDEIAKIGVFD